MKIYSDDPLVHYATTELGPERTKAQIDGILAEYQVKDVGWHYDPPREVFVIFNVEEQIGEQRMRLAIKISCPTIWDRERPKARPPRLEQINWKVSMRAMFWYIKTHLETAYAMQSSKAVAFLPFITNDKGTALKDLILPRLSTLQQLEYTPTDQEAKRQENKIIDIPRGDQSE